MYLPALSNHAPADESRPAAGTRLAPAIELIERQYATRLTLDDLARTVHLHPAYFSFVFKRDVGLSPLRYLARVRLERAKDLLSTTNLPVTQIAAATGFANRSHFTRAFQKTSGLSPSQFRKSKARARVPKAGIRPVPGVRHMIAVTLGPENTPDPYGC